MTDLSLVTPGQEYEKDGLFFPKDFLWGVATSAYQVEGAATEDGRGESIWDRFTQTPGRIKGGQSGLVGADHYHRYEEDLDLLAMLGVQLYRFSVAWPRILPDGKGHVNQQGLDFYRRLVDSLRRRNIEPMATLFHWDLPQALQDLGGWENRDTADYFAHYTDIVVCALGDTVQRWVTINEPRTVVLLGYTTGVHAPGIESRDKARRALHHLLLAHGLAVDVLRQHSSAHQVGIALNLTPIYPITGAGVSEQRLKRVDAFVNRLYLDPIIYGYYPVVLPDELEQIAAQQVILPGDLEIISRPIDYLGVNYYNPTYIGEPGMPVPPQHRCSAASWQEIYPRGLYDILIQVKREYGDIPIYVTEIGAPFEDTIETGGRVHDKERIIFFENHLKWVHQALEKDVNLKCFIAWSFIDNFEWAEGYSQRWGIFYVDFDTKQRIPKDSAYWYRDLIRTHHLKPQMD